MATIRQPIHIFAHALGPNPWKVVILCGELDLPYEIEYIDMADMHTPSYEQHNPNGRVPTIIDPNTGVKIWESGAIIKYLIDVYDTGSSLHITTAPEKYFVDQYLFFQVSGQGPYFGQFTWFHFVHPEQLPSAKERYKNEIKRVTKVLDGLLADGRQYLVGNKCTYADLAFVPWYWLLLAVDPVAPGFNAELEKENPHYAAWNKRLNERPAVKKAFDIRDAKLAAEQAAAN